MPISPYVADLRAKIGRGLLLIPSATVVVFDPAGNVLLAKDIDSGLWMTIGGAIEPEERPADAAVREFWEETHGHVDLLRLIGVFGGPGFTKTYANGDAAAFVVSLFEGRLVGGNVAPDGVETSAIGWFSEAETAALPVSPITKALLPHVFTGRRHPGSFFEPATFDPATADRARDYK